MKLFRRNVLRVSPLLFFVIFFDQEILAGNQSILPHTYSSIIEKLLFFKYDTFKVFYGGPVDRNGPGVRWIMPMVFEDENYKTRAVYEVAFVNCDLHDAQDAEILFVEVSDVNVKFKNQLSSDYSVFSLLLNGDYKKGKYIVVRLADVANIYYPDIFIYASHGCKKEIDKLHIVGFLHEHFYTQSSYRDFYQNEEPWIEQFSDDNLVMYEPGLVRTDVGGIAYDFFVTKIMKKNDEWSLKYV